ncbi:myosin phosphatase Rho-interacting protein-like [Gouania willdenowi]|uniref:myosin phosphatase Rho-interacting protein-like n=1 Tax=Gouania willdenowi TaxID=441366 RepID=UPI001055581E|nr:myosin phosphatase Rho-interacting protein-like [Gouania willdenowi]
MSGEKVFSPCSHFQANIFNKSKCQNCFKSRELHPPNDHDLEQVKPVYAGWLCLAPEGTDFDNPVHRSRKWQRRFFILYEDGALSFALDELPSTLPQGTVDMNTCTNIVDAEPRTGQRNAVWIITSKQEIFIRGDNKDIINGWSEQLTVYLQTNTQHQKKKRKVEPLATQEPSPAKMAATDRVNGHTDENAAWIANVTEPQSPEVAHTGDVSSCLCEAPRDALSADGEHRALDGSRGSSAERLLGSEVNRPEQEVDLPGGRQGRSEARANTREKLSSCGEITQLHLPAAPQRRAKSLERRTSDSVITPDLLNFKKGWMVKQDENDQWKKFWFVLSTDSLRFYRDSMAEEASDLEGEIDLTKCFSVCECQVQRNYGFQIHTSKGIFTLSAMTAGIRKNWIQALMKNVLPANAPDVASLPGHHVSCSPPEVLPKPDVTQDSPVTVALVDRDPHPRPRSASEKLQEGFYRTSDWAEFRPHSEPSSPARSPCSLELMDIERRKKRQERRKRYESILGFSLGWEDVGGKIVDGGVRTLSPKSKRMMEAELEECWRKVEKMMFRPERMILLFTKSSDVMETEKLLQSYMMAPDAPLASDVNKLSLNGQTESVKRSKDLLDLEQLCSPPAPPLAPPSIWLQDADGSLQELEDLFSETKTSPFLSPATESQDDCSESDELLRDDTSDLEDLLDEDNAPLFSSTGTKSDFSSLILETLPDVEKDEEMVVRLSQEVEQLNGQNEALNQRNQEMLNQLTEADREIECLKAELNSRYTEPCHLPEVEQEGKLRLEDLQRELSLRDQQLLEMQALVASLEEDLRESREEPGGPGFLLRCLHTTEDKLTELEGRLGQSEQTREELQHENMELTEKEKLHHERAAEVQKLREEVEKQRLKEENERRERRGEVKSQEVMEQVMTRLQALLKLLETMDGLDYEQEREEEEEEESPSAVTQLKQEQKFWTLVLQKLKNESSVPTDELLSDSKEQNQLLHKASEGSVDLTQHSCDQLTSITQWNICDSDLQPMVDMLHHVPSSLRSRSMAFIRSAATEALLWCRLKELQWKHVRGTCSTCGRLVEENKAPPSSDAGCQTQEPFPQDQTQQISALSGHVEELQAQLQAVTQEFEVKMSSVRMEKEKEVETMKAACERGFSCMEESHLKLVKELQRRHQLELQRLLLERDRLLEEESAATATAIEAIKNAHQLELQREVHRRSVSESISGDALLEETLRQHSEELASHQRELQVLSQQFTLKCLENGHLIQAVDAERKALCQCQQENQDLRTRNQELSGHLAAEITRLCSLAKQDALPLSQRMDVYEMEIMLRVKESEVQCLKQEISSLKDELQSAQKEKRSATKKYKDMYTELSIVRAKAERDADELRENLQLAHLALGHTAP